MKIAALMTCHNRVEKTRKCLSLLLDQGNVSEDDVYLVDDGSSDGTGETVASEYPRVNLISGDGNLFWNGGMRLAWETARRSGQDYDYYLWMNDDVEIYPGTIGLMVGEIASLKLHDKPVIMCAATVWSDDLNVINYGEQVRPDPRRRPLRLKLVSPSGTPQAVATMSGNIVLVSAAAFAILGNLYPGFKHIYGDIDYGLRAERAGIPVYLCSEIGGNVSPTFRKEARLTRPCHAGSV